MARLLPEGHTPFLDCLLAFWETSDYSTAHRQSLPKQQENKTIRSLLSGGLNEQGAFEPLLFPG